MRRGAPLARLLAALVIALLGPALPARAAPPPDTEALARRHFVRGKQLFDDHKYREAAEEFEAGYAVAAKPGFLLNIGHSYRRAGDLRKARRYYELFLDKDAASPQRGEVQGIIKSIDDALADQREEAAYPEAAAAPEGAKPSAAPLPEAAPALAATGGGSAPVHVDACVEGRSRERDRPLWPWLVSGAAVLIAGGIAAAVILSRSSPNDTCGSLGCVNER